MRNLILGTCAVLLLGACTSTPEADGPDLVAGQLAGALSSKDVAGIPFTTTEPVEVTPLLGPLADAPAEVRATDVATSGDTATATLAWTWDLGGHAWSYDTSADLTRVDGGWRVAWSPAVVEPSLNEGETLDTDVLQPQRGDILGGNGKPLVTDRDIVRYGLDKTMVKPAQVPLSAKRIARVLDIDLASYVKRAEAAGPRAFVEALVLRRTDARRLDPAYADIPGAAAVTGQLPLAPTREFAAPILGSVGPATAEIIEKSDGAVEAGDVVGLSGLQARYDEQLRGTVGVRVRAVDAQGRDRILFTAEPVDGEPLRTTLDEKRQLKAERILARVPAAEGASAIVALRPSTGDVLVAANGPGAGGVNIATFGQYAPGSTFKIVSSLALLRKGLRPDSPVSCPPSIVVDGKTFTNYDDYPASGLGRITLRQAVANSCNTAIIGAGSRLRDAALGAAAAALGFGVDHDLGFPAYFGQVPTPEGRTEAAADLIGQGKVLASPLAMAAVAASAQAGKAVLPRLLPDVETAQEAQEAPSSPLTGPEATALRGLLRAVVTGGSGAFLADLPGRVGAKTGTAEYGEPGPGGALPTHTWMIATQGDLAVAVFVETGQSGSGTAGPLLEAFLR